jgi:hypothetical protein
VAGQTACGIRSLADRNLAAAILAASLEGPGPARCPLGRDAVLGNVGDPNGAHTLSEHVLDDQAARAKAERDGIATVWNDQDTAVRCIHEAFQQWLQRSPKNGKKLTDWITAQRKKPKSDIFDPRYDLFPIEWELRGEGSLGKIRRKRATTPDNAGNKVSINIKAVRAKAHPGDPDANVPNNFVIYTAYPK